MWPQSTVTKFVADGRGVRPLSRAICGDAGAGGGDVRADFGEVGLVGQRREGAGLRDAADAEVVADLVEGPDEIGVADAVADAEAGHAVTL